LPSNTFSGSVISPILKENELHTWNERYMKRLIESGERVGLLSRSIQPKSNSSPQSCFAWKGENTWNEDKRIRSDLLTMPIGTVVPIELELAKER
jgi:hypothetical protein